MATPNATPPTATSAGLALALAADGQAPGWVQLMPAGPAIEGRDGRRWTMADPTAVARRSRVELAVDYEHAQDLKAPQGEPAPAAGWVEALAVRNGQIWAQVSWTEKARAAIAAREYRFVSPAFTHTREGEVVEIVGAGLVNRPNFDMTALARREPPTLTTDGAPMKEVLKALGLAETATEAEALTALGALRTALNAQQPSLEKFVPRADYEVAVNRATTAEATLAAQAKAGHEAKVAAAIDGALKAGKIAPASKDFYLATCSTADGLASFEKFVAGAPSVFGESSVGREDPAKKDAVALNAEQKAAAKALGIPEADLAKFVAAQAA